MLTILTIAVIATLGFNHLIEYLNKKKFSLNPKTEAYNNELYNYTFINNLFSTMLTLILLWGGYEYFYSVTEYYTNNTIFSTTITMILVMSLFSLIVFLPFEFYLTFMIERKYKKTDITEKEFYKSIYKRIFKNSILYLLAIVFLYVFKNILDFNDFKYDFSITDTILSVIFVTALIHIYQIAELFFMSDIKPLNDGDLKTDIEELCKKVNFKNYKIMVIKSNDNASVFSFFGKTYIMISQSLLEKLNNKQILSIIIHEVGHVKKYHLYIEYLFKTIEYCLIVVICTLLYNYIDAREILHFKENVIFGKAIVISILYSCDIFLPFYMLYNYVSRKHEFEADNYVKELGYSEHLISVFKDLFKDDFGDKKSKLDLIINHTHPTLYERIENLNK